MGRRIVIVGGGSSRWGPRLLADMMLTPSIAGSTYVLHDLNAANAQRIARLAWRLRSELQVPATVQTEEDPDRALEDADFVVVTISTGGYEAMAPDLAIPEEYGIYHTVGDTVGPAGWARTLRNAPVFVDLAQRINRLAPRAVILNYTNPMAQLTEVLCLHTDRPVIGLCHGLFETLRFLQAALGLESADDIQCSYAGVNHFFWITSLTVGGRDGYQMLRERMDGASLADLMAQVRPGRPGGYLTDELFRVTGMLSYVAEGHVAEFFPQFLTSRERMAEYHLRLVPIERRQERMRQAEAQVEAMTTGEVPDRYRQRSREAAADIINAFVTGEPMVEVGNLPNVGQVSSLPLGPVLETPVLVTATGFRPVTVDALPEPVCTWVARYARVEDLTARAAIEGDLNKALQALVLDPLCSHLDFREVRRMGMRLLKANQQYLPQFEDHM